MNNTQGSLYGPTMTLNYVAITAVTATGTATFTATPVGTAAAISYCVRGKAFTKATITTTSPGTTDAITGAAFLPLAASKACLVVIGLDAGGNIKSCQGPIVSVDSGGNIAPSYLEFPLVPDTIAPFCYIVCKNGSTGSAWTFGTSLWDATGMTATPVSIVAIPDRPQIS